MLPEAKAKKMKKKASEELRFGVISNTLRKAVFTWRTEILQVKFLYECMAIKGMEWKNTCGRE